MFWISNGEKIRALGLKEIHYIEANGGGSSAMGCKVPDST